MSEKTEDKAGSSRDPQREQQCAAAPSAAVTEPRRVQLSRAKGWRMPPNTVVVSRPSRWGNPFKVGGYVRVNHNLPILIRTPEVAVILFREVCMFHVPDLTPLRGKNLACWCKLPAPGEPDICHAAVLLELANRPSPCEAPQVEREGSRATVTERGDEM